MSAQTFVHRITKKRSTHIARPIVIRILYVIGGFALLVPGTPLLIIFPEAGIPLVLFGLGILSLEYIWASKILSRFAVWIDKTILWYKKLSRPIRYTIELFFLVVAIIITWLIFR